MPVEQPVIRTALDEELMRGAYFPARRPARFVPRAHIRGLLVAHAARLRLDPSHRCGQPAPMAPRDPTERRETLDMRVNSYARRELEVARLAADAEGIVDLDELRGCGLRNRRSTGG